MHLTALLIFLYPSVKIVVDFAVAPTVHSPSEIMASVKTSDFAYSLKALGSSVLNPYLEDHPSGCKWLRSPPIYQHYFRPFGRGITPVRGLTVLTSVIIDLLPGMILQVVNRLRTIEPGSIIIMPFFPKLPLISMGMVVKTLSMGFIQKISSGKLT